MDYIYTRVSTDAQNETSFQVQEETVRNQLKMVSNSPITVIQETGSGKDTEGRPKFLDMLSKLQKGDIVAIYDNSRLGRNTEISLFLLKEITNKGARLLCDGKFIDPDNPTDFMLWSIQSSFSTYQRQIQNQKSIEGLRKKYDNGDAVFNERLFGYETIKKGKSVKAVIVEEEAKVIRYIFEQYDKGRNTNNIFNEVWGTPFERGFIMNRNSLRDYLKRPLYMGYYFTERGMTRKATNLSRAELEPLLVKSNIYPPIVDEELWWRVHNSWRTVSRVGTVPFKNRFTPHDLSGIFHCPDCGKGMAHNVRKNQVPYYDFGTHLPDCKTKYMTAYRADWLENIVRACFYITFLMGDEVGAFFEEQRAKMYESTNELQIALDNIDTQIKAVNTKVERIVDAITEGIIDSSNAKSKMDKLKREKQGLEEQRDNIAKDIQMKMADVDDFLEVSATEVMEDFDCKRRFYYKKFVKSGYNYHTHLTLEFMNGKTFKIYRPKRHQGTTKDSIVEVAHQGEAQFNFTYHPEVNSITILTEMTGDIWKDAELNYFKEIEEKVNNSLN